MKDCCKVNASPIVISTISGEPVMMASPIYSGELKGTYCPVCGDVTFSSAVILENNKGGRS